MLSPNPLPGQFAGKQAHFKRGQQAFFPGHRPLNFELDALHRRACVRDEHGQMLPRGSLSAEFLPAPDVLPIFSWISENVDQGPNAAAIHQSFMKSSQHRANILDTDTDCAGIGVAEHNCQLFAVENFSKAK